jgi:hypothetical protein
MKFKEDYCRRLRATIASRRKWKQRVAENQETIRYLRVRVRDLEESRAFWKKCATTAKPTHDGLLGECVADSVDLERVAPLTPTAAAPMDDQRLGEV